MNNARQFVAACTAVLLLSLLAREWFVLVSVFPNPTQGDVSAYLRYALHLLWDGTFSQAATGESVVPDAFRAPGYPFFLLLLYKVAGPQSWFAATYQAQVILGVITIFNTILIVRLCVNDALAIVAGAWLALEPHLIAATGTLLAETLFGFLISTAMLVTLKSLVLESKRWGAMSGAIFGCAYLVNPVIALFPVALIPVYVRRKMSLTGVLVLAISLLAVGAWGVRNAWQHSANDTRSVLNFAQGSWPNFYEAWKYQLVDPHAKENLDQISADTKSFVADPKAGFSRLLDRVSRDPGTYAYWYFIRKPFSLWDWNIRFGAGGPYVVDVQNSPLDKNPLLRFVSGIQQWLNPFVVFFAVVGSLLTFRNVKTAPLGLFFFYVTIIHAILQAEPRYSIPFKSVEIVLVMCALNYVFTRPIFRRRNRASADVSGLDNTNRSMAT